MDPLLEFTMRRQPPEQRDIILEAIKMGQNKKTSLTKQQALEILRKYNEWRRYDGLIGEGPDMPKAHDIGKAIDLAIEVLQHSARPETNCEATIHVFNNPTHYQEYAELPPQVATVFLTLDANEYKEGDIVSVTVEKK